MDAWSHHSRCSGADADDAHLPRSIDWSLLDCGLEDHLRAPIDVPVDVPIRVGTGVAVGGAHCERFTGYCSRYSMIWCRLVSRQ